MRGWSGGVPGPLPQRDCSLVCQAGAFRERRLGRFLLSDVRCGSPSSHRVVVGTSVTPSSSGWHPRERVRSHTPAARASATATARCARPSIAVWRARVGSARGATARRRRNKSPTSPTAWCTTAPSRTSSWERTPRRAPSASGGPPSRTPRPPSSAASRARSSAARYDPPPAPRTATQPPPAVPVGPRLTRRRPSGSRRDGRPLRR